MEGPQAERDNDVPSHKGTGSNDLARNQLSHLLPRMVTKVVDKPVSGGSGL